MIIFILEFLQKGVSLLFNNFFDDKIAVLHEQKVFTLSSLLINILIIVIAAFINLIKKHFPLKVCPIMQETYLKELFLNLRRGLLFTNNRSEFIPA